MAEAPRWSSVWLRSLVLVWPWGPKRMRRKPEEYLRGKRHGYGFEVGQWVVMVVFNGQYGFYLKKNLWFCMGKSVTFNLG